MRLRNINIIVCDCGVERNPDISTPFDLLQYADGIATCFNCGASGAIVLPVEETPVEVPTIDVVALDATVTELVETLNTKGLIP